jgi:hypothetical protein
LKQNALCCSVWKTGFGRRYRPAAERICNEWDSRIKRPKKKCADLSMPSGYSAHHQFNTHKFYVLPTRYSYVFCVDLRKKQRLFPYGFYNRGGVCLLRGTDWTSKCNSRCSLTGQKNVFVILGIFTKLRKATISFFMPVRLSYCLSTCLSVCLSVCPPVRV